MAAPIPAGMELGLRPPVASEHLRPDALSLGLTLPGARAWIGGPSENCWTMRYNTVLSQWELEGGNGLVLYRQSSTWDCFGPNTFDQLVTDQTLQAPASITVWPFAPVPCDCPLVASPDAPNLRLNLFPPYVHGELVRPIPALLTLTTASPSVDYHVSPAFVGLALAAVVPAIHGHIGPTPIVLTLTTSTPAVDLHVEPTPLVLTLTASQPVAWPPVKPYQVTLFMDLLQPTVSETAPPTSTHSAQFDTFSESALFLSADVSGQTHSFSCWFKFSTIPGTAVFVGFGSGGLQISTTAGGAITWGRRDFFSTSTGGNSIADSAWHHLLCCFDGSTLQIFLDGSSILNTSASPGTFGWNPGAAVFGVQSPTNQTYRMTDVRLYQSDESANVATIYNGTCPDLTDATTTGGNLKNWWQCETAPLGVIPDDAGTHPATLSGGASLDTDCPCP